MNIWEITEEALDTLNVPIAANVLIPASGTALPDLYLVYTLISSPPEQHADNDETLRSYRVQVSAYSRLGTAAIPNIDAAMLAAGFTRSGKRELPYSRETRHFGLAQDYIYLMNGDDDDGY